MSSMVSSGKFWNMVGYRVLQVWAKMFFYTYHSPLQLDPSKTWAGKQIWAGSKNHRIGERRIQTGWESISQYTTYRNNTPWLSHFPTTFSYPAESFTFDSSTSTPIRLSSHPILTTPIIHHPSHLLVAAMIFTVVCEVKPSNWFNSSNMVRCTSRTPHQWVGSRGGLGRFGRWIDRVKRGT